MCHMISIEGLSKYYPGLKVYGVAFWYHLDIILLSSTKLSSIKNMMQILFLLPRLHLEPELLFGKYCWQYSLWVRLNCIQLHPFYLTFAWPHNKDTIWARPALHHLQTHSVPIFFGSWLFVSFLSMGFPQMSFYPIVDLFIWFNTWQNPP